MSNVILVIVSGGYTWLYLSLSLMFFFEITKCSYYHEQV